MILKFLHELALKYPFQLYGSALILIALPWSAVAVSVGFFVISIHALFHPEIVPRIRKIWSNTNLCILLSLYAVYLFGMLYTHDLAKGLSILRIKLPLLLAPIILFAFADNYLKNTLLLIRLFALSVFVHAIAGLIDFEWLRPEQGKIPSFFISYIRLSLLMCMALMIAWYEASQKSTSFIYRIGWLMVSIIILYNIIYIKSLTAYLALIAAIPVYLYFYLHKKYKKVFLATLIVIGTFSGIFVYNIASPFIYPFQEWNPKYDSLTPRGNTYTHNNIKEIENGYYVSLYLCEQELRDSWNKISTVQYDSADYKGHPLKYTLHRYLTYLHLPKNGDGVHALNSQQINEIEQGYANPLQAKKRSVANKIYTLFWEMHAAANGAKAEGRSNALRLIYWATSWQIIEEQPILGVGTGDIQQAFEKQYKANKSDLPPSMQLQSHNQWLSVAASVGVFGVLSLFAHFAALFFVTYSTRMAVFKSISAVLFVSMLTEDMLNNQIGVTVYAFFISIFLLSSKKHK